MLFYLMSFSRELLQNGNGANYQDDYSASMNSLPSQMRIKLYEVTNETL